MKRRNFLKSSAALAGMAASGLAFNPAETYSAPSDLRITDIRGCTVRAGGENYPIIKIYTNQDVYGLGEVRDSARLGQALVLKSHLVGRDPLNIEGVLRRIKPLAGQGRAGGGYSAIDMALCDIAGKVLGIPAYRLLGSKRRDNIPAYCDTVADLDPKALQEKMKKRFELGFKNYKMDLYKRLIQNKPGALAGQSPTDKGLEYWGEYVAAVRDVIGWENVLGSDHFGSLTVDDGIRLGKAMEKYSMAYIEDVINYDRPNSVYRNKQITDNSPTPTLNGEDIFGFEAFRPWIENNAVDIIQQPGAGIVTSYDDSVDRWLGTQQLPAGSINFRNGLNGSLYCNQAPTQAAEQAVKHHVVAWAPFSPHQHPNTLTAQL